MASIFRYVVRIISLFLILGIPNIASTEARDNPSRWIGATDTAAGKFGWPGSGFELKFSGTKLEVVMTDSGKNSLVAVLDGAANRLDLVKGTEAYVVAEGPASGEHSVRAYRRTEGLFEPTTFVSTTTDGQFKTAFVPERQILVIGDLISAGYGIEGTSSDCKFSGDTQNQFLTYAALAGRQFGADVATIAVSGRGLVHNCGGSKTGTMPEILDRAVP